MYETLVLRDKIGSAMRPKSSCFLLHTRMSFGSHVWSQVRKNCILQSLLGSRASYEKRQNCDPTGVIPMNKSIQQPDIGVSHPHPQGRVLVPPPLLPSHVSEGKIWKPYTGPAAELLIRSRLRKRLVETFRGKSKVMWTGLWWSLTWNLTIADDDDDDDDDEGKKRLV